MLEIDEVEYFLLPTSVRLRVHSSTPRSSMPTYEMLGEHSRNLVARLIDDGDMVSMAGTLSPITPTTLPDGAKQAAGIPREAAYYAFAYPLECLAASFDAIMQAAFSGIMPEKDEGAR